MAKRKFFVSTRKPKAPPATQDNRLDAYSQYQLVQGRGVTNSAYLAAAREAEREVEEEIRQRRIALESMDADRRYNS